MHRLFSTFNPLRSLVYADHDDGQLFLRSLGLENIVEGSMEKDGQATVYVCEGFTCKQPTSDLDVFSEQLLAVQSKDL